MKTLNVLLLLLVALLVGCGEIPALPEVDLGADPSWLDDSRGGHDWNATSGVFSVDAPSRWTFFGDIDRQLVAQNLRRPEFVPPDGPLTDSDIPEGVDQFNYLRLREKQPPKAKAIASLPVNGAVRHLQMTSEGGHLLVHTEETAIWTLDSPPKKRVLPLTVKNEIDLFLADGGKTLTVVNANEVTQFDTDSMEIRRQWRPVGAKIVVSDYARVAGRLLVGQSDRRVVLLDENLSELNFKMVTGEEIERHDIDALKEVAINETGTLCVASFGNCWFQCVNREGQPWAQRITSDARVGNARIGVGAGSVVFWEDGLLVDNRTVNASYDSFPRYEFLIPGDVVDISVAHITETFQWAVMLTQAYLDGQWQYVVQDAGMHYWAIGGPLPLGTQRPKQFVADAPHERLAVLYDDRIDLIPRRRWSDSTIKAHFDNLIADMKGDNKLATIRAFEEAAAAQPVLAPGYTSDELLASAANYIANGIFNSMRSTSDVEPAVQEWLDKGSRLAIATEIALELHRRMYWYFDDSQEEKYDRLIRKLNRDTPDSLLALVCEARLLSHDIDGNEKRLGELAAKATELYPYCANVHVYLHTSNEEEGNNLTAVNSYLVGLTQCYPEAERDLMYAVFGLALSKSLRTGYANPGESLNPKRMSAGFQEYAKIRNMQVQDLANAFQFAFDSNDTELTKTLAEHQLGTHPLLPVSEYDRQIYQQGIEFYRQLGSN